MLIVLSFDLCLEDYQLVAINMFVVCLCKDLNLIMTSRVAVPVVFANKV